MAFNGDVARERAAQILALAEKQGGKVPLMLGHRCMGVVLGAHGKLRGSPRTLRSGDCALRSCRTSARWRRGFGQDLRVSALIWRSLALWALGYPEAGARRTRNKRSVRRVRPAMPAALMHAMRLHADANSSAETTRQRRRYRMS